MTDVARIAIPSVVRVKVGALDRLGIYLGRHEHRRVLLMTSEGMLPDLLKRAEQSLANHGIVAVKTRWVEEASFELAAQILADVPRKVVAVVGLGGGRALDVAKYVASLAGLPYYAVPTSLSNDGFCSPQSSLTMQGRRRSLPAALPFAVVIDTEVCMNAPRPLWLSGVGDLMAKVTAVFDWKLAFRQVGELVNDFAALLSDATVFQFMARPVFDLEGAGLLGTSLMLNGIAMEISGSSRPASGGEHLISHALDLTASRPRLHGLQVGMATYIISQLQKNETDRIVHVFDETGFWHEIQSDPFSRDHWLEAARLAPTIKEDFFTILSTVDPVAAIAQVIDNDPRLAKCFS